MIMKRLIYYSLFLLLFASFVLAVDSPDTGIGGEDVEAIQNITDNIPIDPNTGKFVNPLEPTKAEERIAAINGIIGPFTTILFGVELTLSWIFVFSFLMWILLIEIILFPVHDLFGFSIIPSLVMSTVISSLAMHGFGKDLVLWMAGIATGWWAALVAVVVIPALMIIYAMFSRTFAAKIKEGKKAAREEEVRRSEDYITMGGKLAKKEFSDRTSKK